MFDDKIILTGIDPKSSAHQLIYAELLQLLDEAPSDASINFNFSNEPEGAVGIANICSQQGKFVASFAGVPQRPQEACDHIVSELREKLSLWKASRFKPAS